MVFLCVLFRIRRFTGFGPMSSCEIVSTSNETLSCFTAPCGDPGIPKHSRRKDHDFRHNKKVQFSCLSNTYVMEGEDEIKCINGHWNKDTPKCFCKFAQINTNNGLILKVMEFFESALC